MMDVSKHAMGIVQLGRAQGAHRGASANRASSEYDPPTHGGDCETTGDVVSRHLDRCTENRLLPPSIAQFLDDHWRSFLTGVYAREGDQGQTWLDVLKTTEDLTWSVQPKTDEPSRKAFFKLLPDLQQRLHSALISAGWAVKDEDAFFSELALLHVAALHPKTPSKPIRASGDTRGRAGEACEIPSGYGTSGKRVNGARAAHPSGTVPDAESAPATMGAKRESPENLNVGVSVRFTGEYATSRTLRLTWISRQGGVYFFRNEDTGETLYLTSASLAARLHAGSASVVL